MKDMKDMKEQIALAEQIARKAHEGQFRTKGADKGKPYIVHPERVANRLKSDPILECVGWLHDVVEDTSITFDDLLKQGVLPEIVEILKFVTRPKGENYFDFCKRIAKNLDAIELKLADLEDNMSSLEECGAKDKYRFAKAYLEREKYVGRCFYLERRDCSEFYEWRKEHDKTCRFKGERNLGAIGGRFTWSFLETGLGAVVTVKCACGEELDLTHVEDW
jgi:hypothetical protein